MATLRYIANDILTMLKQMTDDADITLNHIVYWCVIYGERLRYQHLQKIDNDSFTHTYVNVEVQTDPLTGEKYITLPTGIMNLDKDKGIVYITYGTDVDCQAYTSNTFSRTTRATAKNLYWTPEETPSPSNPYFIVEQTTKVLFLGWECIDVKYVTIGLLSALNPTSPCPLDEEWDFPPELLVVLQRQVLELGRLVLMISEERLNQGNFESDGQPKTRISSMETQSPLQQQMAQQQAQQQQSE